MTKKAKKETIANRYGPAMAVTTIAEARQIFDELVAGCVAKGKSRQEAEKIERSNLGYYAGYFDSTTRARVEKLFKCEHPIFGAIANKGQPSPEQAFKMGYEWATRTKDQFAELDEEKVATVRRFQLED